MLPFRRIKPLMNRILVMKPTVEEKSKGGILLPSSKSNRANTAVVVDVGPGIKVKGGKIRECLVKVGDVVLLPEHEGRKVTMAEDSEFFLYRDEDIMGVLSEKVM